MPLSKLQNCLIARWYYLQHRQESIAKAQEYRRKNKKRLILLDKLRHQKKDYDTGWRVKTYGNNGSHTLEEWELRKQIYNYRCVYCKKKTILEKDHIIPLSKGGSNNIDNIVPACKHCNSGKNNRLKYLDTRAPCLPLPL